jgi:hypothetical protein
VAALVLLLVPLAAGIVLLVTGRGGTLWFFGLPVLTGLALMVGSYLVWGTDAFLLRYLYAFLPPFAIAVADAALRTVSWRRVATVIGVLSLIAAVLWIDMAGAFYFTDAGSRLGI